MYQRFDLLVFDWDGTLFDSTNTIVGAIQAASRDLGLPEPKAERARHVIGLELSHALRYAVPELPEGKFQQMIDRYKHHYLSCDQELRLFDGVFDLINELHASGVMLAVATGKSRLGLNRALSNTGLREYFAATRCADECFSKPHPQMLDELMDELSVLPEQTLMIGDTTHDLQMAVNAGVSGLAVDYGAHSADVLDSLNPLARLHSVLELSGWLKQHT